MAEVERAVQLSQDVQAMFEKNAASQQLVKDRKKTLRELTISIDNAVRQLEGLDSVISVKRGEVNELLEACTALEIEEARLQANIQDANLEFQDLLTDRNETDRQLSQALIEKESQGRLVEASLRQFDSQMEVLQGTLEKTVFHVVSLQGTLAVKQEELAAKERLALEQEAIQAEREASEQAELRASLLDIERELASQQQEAEEEERLTGEAELAISTVEGRLVATESELAALQELQRKQVTSKAEKRLKREKLVAQRASVRHLEEELEQTRSELAAQRAEVLQLHAEIQGQMQADGTNKFQLEMSRKRLEEMERGADDLFVNLEDSRQMSQTYKNWVCETKAKIEEARLQVQAKEAQKAALQRSGLPRPSSETGLRYEAVQVEIARAKEELERTKARKTARELQVRLQALRAQAEREKRQARDQAREKRQAVQAKLARSKVELQALTLGLVKSKARRQTKEPQREALLKQVEDLKWQSQQQQLVREAQRQEQVRRRAAAEEAARLKDLIDQARCNAETADRNKRMTLNRLKRELEKRATPIQDTLRAIEDGIHSCELKIRAKMEQMEHSRREQELWTHRANAMARGPRSDSAALRIAQVPLPSNAGRRKALVIGSNYETSHAPLKGCVNDAWHFQCYLKTVMQFQDDQIRLLLDATASRNRPERLSTRANMTAGLQWLVAGAQPGDELVFMFSGYGCQHPDAFQPDLNEGFLVPSDFADDLPADFFASSLDSSRQSGSSAATIQPGGSTRSLSAGYRLLAMREIAGYVKQLPPQCRLTVILDCCYATMPDVYPGGVSSTFPKVDRGVVNYASLRDYVSRPRFLELPPLTVQGLRPRSSSVVYPLCELHCFTACGVADWCAELPIEGTTQGAFTWSILKALTFERFHANSTTLHQTSNQLVTQLKTRFKGISQRSVLQLSAGAQAEDIFLWR